MDFAAILVASSVASMGYWLKSWVPNPGARVKNYWTDPRLIQRFILPRLVK